MNFRINFMLHGQLGQVICFRNDLAPQIVSNLAIKGATMIEVIRTNVDEDHVERFRAFIDAKDKKSRESV